jgi:hypothetical protein
MTEVSAIARLKIHEGKLEEFKRLAAMELIPFGGVLHAVGGVSLDLHGRPPSDGGQVTATNWSTHPAIKAIRTLVDANESAIRAGSWNRAERPICDPPALETRRIVFRDHEGRVRKFVSEGGSDDSAYRLEHHYDESGRLRFAFGRSGAVSQTIVEHRLYFAESGALLWKDRRQTGPGYTFAAEWPEEFLVRDPALAFDAPKQCK